MKPPKTKPPHYSYRSATTTTWVPLTDINGSTIALVNSALPTSPPGATYIYDPSGNVSVNGSNATSWRFQYGGMEHEPTDPANLYFNSSSNVYNPQMQTALSQVGAQGLGGPSIASPDGPAQLGRRAKGAARHGRKLGMTCSKLGALARDTLLRPTQTVKAHQWRFRWERWLSGLISW